MFSLLKLGDITAFLSAFCSLGCLASFGLPLATKPNLRALSRSTPPLSAVVALGGMPSARAYVLSLPKLGDIAAFLSSFCSLGRLV